jgi:hypothetical protein
MGGTPGTLTLSNFPADDTAHAYIYITNSTAHNAIKSDVSFTNGSATIDYNSMTKQSSLSVGVNL